MARDTALLLCPPIEEDEEPAAFVKPRDLARVRFSCQPRAAAMGACAIVDNAKAPRKCGPRCRHRARDARPVCVSSDARCVTPYDLGPIRGGPREPALGASRVAMRPRAARVASVSRVGTWRVRDDDPEVGRCDP